MRSKGFMLGGGSFNHEKVRYVYEDSKHNLYFVPDRGLPLRTNLQLSEHELLKNAGVTGPLPSSVNPMFVIEGNDGLMWIGSSDGLVCTDLKDRYNYFTRFDGLPDLSFTLCKPVRDEEGNLWFGNARGLVMLDQDKFANLHKERSKVKITEARVNGKIIADGGAGIDKINLRNGERSLEVFFSDFSFTSPEYQSFEYRLSPRMGVDEWERVHGASEISLYDLDNGDYTLHIRHLGEPSSEVELPISVRDYGYFFTWPMMALCALVLVMAVCLGAGLLKMRKLGKMVEEGGDSRYTLTAMSEKCGFSSRASFFRSFGKSMGVSPGEYIRRLHEKDG